MKTKDYDAVSCNTAFVSMHRYADMSHRAMLPKNMSEEAGTAWLIGTDLSVEKRKRKPLLTTIAQKNALALTKLHAAVCFYS